MRYEEYEPPIELEPWIKLFWVFECRSNSPIPETIVADGFPELIVHFHSPFAEAGCNGEYLRQPVAVACGQLTRPLVLQSSKDAGMIGIRFQPSGMSPFLTTSMQSLTDTRVEAKSLFPEIDQLVDEVMHSTNDGQRVAACNRFLLRTLNLDRDNNSVRRALAEIMYSRGQMSVEDLASRMGISRRSMELAFKKSVGTSPKMYCRITRFRNIVDAVTENTNSVDWVNLALESGFFDQPHLIRDFRRFAGESPTSFLAEQTSFANSINQS